MVRIKICGLTNEEDARAAVDCGAAALGFVFAPSPRQIKKTAAKEIIERIPPWITIVGVFVNESNEKIIQTASFCGLDNIQLHGEESPEQCEELMKNGLKVIKVLHPKTEVDLKIIKEYKVKGIHLDTYDKEKAGGTGKAFNWDLAIAAKKYKQPIILAGGLDPDNIAVAIEKVKPYGVDVSSGVEQYPGKKDLVKMEKFIRLVRGTVV